ncbi:MAG TPA: hypothetical protein VFV34_06290 [Blastocatellia bacterium]|nr:hypothetical protein [Blastocatellia bacterium]
MTIRLFVGNLPFTVTEAELRELFSAVGSPTYLSLPIDRESGKPRGFAFVEFSDATQADEAIRRFNAQPFNGRTLAVNEARPKEANPRGSAPYRSPSSGHSPPARPEIVGPPSLRPSNNFGPDAVPQRRRGKAKGGGKSDRGPKKPMRELFRGQFFGGDENDSPDNDWSGDNFASRVSDPESEDVS